MTAMFEMDLADVLEGKMKSEAFLKKIEGFVENMIKEAA